MSNTLRTVDVSWLIVTNPRQISENSPYRKFKVDIVLRLTTGWVAPVKKKNNQNKGDLTPVEPSRNSEIYHGLPSCHSL